MARLDDRPRLSAAVTVLMAVAVLLLAWGHGSPTSARAAIGDATGPLVADSLGGRAILSAYNLEPGAGRTGEVTVTNVGDSAGEMMLGASNLTDVVAQAGAALSSRLDLTVLDVTAGRAPSLVYNGALGSFAGARLGTFEQNERRRYRFIVVLPSAGADGADNPYMGASTTVSFVWTATGLTDPGPQAGGPSGGAGTTAPAPAGGADLPAAPPADVLVDHVEQSRAPDALKLGVYVRRTQAAHRRRVYVNVSCSHRCTLTATGVVSLPSQKRTWKLKALRGRVTKPGTVKFRMPLPRQALQPLDTALLHRRRASVRLKLTARSGAQTLHWTRTVRLAR